MRSPSCRAIAPAGGSCSLFLTSADWAPAVERPSSHSAASMMPRNAATSCLLNTSGTQISIKVRSKLCRGDQRDAAPWRDGDKRHAALINRVVVRPIEDVLDVELHRRIRPDLGLRERVEAPM